MKKTREALGRDTAKQDALLREQLPGWFDAVRQIGNPAHRFLTEFLQARTASVEPVKRGIGELARGGVLSRRLAEGGSAPFDVENIIANLEQQSDRFA